MKPRFGFNLLDMFVEASDTRYPHMFPGHAGNFRAADFAFIARTGFDYVRLPLCYRNWIRNRNPLDIDPEKLTPLDRAVELGLKHGIHVSINLHHAPGFCINHPIGWGEPFNLWKDSAGLEAFLLHWTTIAERFKGVDPDALSFNLVNEPPPVGYGMSREDYVRVMTAGTRAIHAVEPERLVVVDGINVGIDPAPEMLDEPVSFGCRGYLPFPLTHYLAEWGPGTHTRVPKWPFVDRNGTVFDKDDFRRVYKPWIQMQRLGADVHCGEFGCHHKTPHRVALAWMEDLLSVLNETNIGFAMWNLRGSLGIADSGREDVEYRSLDGYQVDTKMLELLQSHM
jgi:endoglucanase